MSSKLESMTGKADLAFPEYDDPPDDPIALGQRWLREAIEEKVCEPRAMVLVTANGSGLMSSRVMAILEFAGVGIVFATHATSRKIKDSMEVPYACGHFYWRELSRQLSVSGKIVALSRERAVAEWNKRPVPLHSMSTASRQSEPLVSSEVLLNEAQRLAEAGALPCPERFMVYALQPLALEFWASSSNRLHRRLRFDLAPEGWKSARLQP
ncbi:Pyridoxamine 5'-phosphate oxidase [Nannocystis exedens]|uniref:Pyridoxamine 5'-phosphate oxidase n=1 Tax=Nannocystis exedens TaxID=54 RepID=A0A1I1XGH8_9BACT|nr:pyridoxal 5'-phosphate synthase [Nannocystis exedens]PCC73437.1 Phenazine biosynthesis protein PhzG [Nannocystis exedens]SFE06271.1 Pyridoxamine 5'-phosphate oxidase [Nannocystis exedens]